MEIALFQPDIAGNVGTILLTAACFGVPAHIIEPCGFPFGDAALKRAGMDYAVRANVRRHPDWQTFRQWSQIGGQRIVLLTTAGATPLPDFDFGHGDVLLFGRESAGVPDDVHAGANARVTIPMAAGQRSLNVVTSASIALWEACRQTSYGPLGP